MVHEISKEELAQRAEYENQIDEIQKRAKREFRDLSPLEKSLIASNEIIMAEIHKRYIPIRVTTPQQPGRGPGFCEIRSCPPGEWRDKSGNTVAVLGSENRMVDFVRRPDDIDPTRLSLGRAIRAAITGKWQQYAPDEARVLAEGTNTLGGMIVPDVLSANFLDLVRAQTVVLKAGAQVVPMTSDTLTIASQTADPVLEIKAENSAFAGSDITFGAVHFTAFTMGTIVTASQELAEDAPNFSAIVENALVKALAVKLDSLALVGSASGNPGGIKTTVGVGESAGVGAIAWEDYLAALESLELVNAKPNAYVISPGVKHDLGALTTGDGVNAGKDWLAAPADVAALTRFVTTSCPADQSYIGDFSQMYIGLRQDPRIEFSKIAGDTFSKHQLAIKIVWRGDIVLARPTHFHRLIGIS